MPDDAHIDRLPLSRSQQNLYSGVLQDGDPSLYLIGKSYRFRPLSLPTFLAALQATTLANPVQLCVLEPNADPSRYPDLVPRLEFSDIVRVCSDTDWQSVEDAGGIENTWHSGILAKPLVRYIARTDQKGDVSALEVSTHHILMDGGATAIIEADLARYLGSDGNCEIPSLNTGLDRLLDAHRRESDRVEDSRTRLAPAVQRELADEARQSRSNDGLGSSAGAAKGVLQESVRVSGESYEALLALSEAKQIPLNILVAAAAVAVDASLRQSTECLLVHAVDNRFGDPALDVATCLVNSIAHSVRFPPFASVADVVRTLDRGYVRAVRRRWIREEHYRRMYMALNRTVHVDTLTLNFIREPCAPDLRPFLLEAPVATDIGPVEGMAVASVLNESDGFLSLAIWNRADLPASQRHDGVVQRIAAALESMTAMWDEPMAATVGEWSTLGMDGKRCRALESTAATESRSPAWFLGATGGVSRIRKDHPLVDPWLAWLVRSGVAPGAVLVFADDNTDKTVDLLIACHLAGCGYSVCDDPHEIPARAQAITDDGDSTSAFVVDVPKAQLATTDDNERTVIQRHLDEVAHSPALADTTAYLMPTSGSTGQPKLVRISHRSLAVFCAAAREAYGWNADDTVLQCAPLTSDISVEEIFGAAMSGSALVRSTATRTGDLAALGRELAVKHPTIVDLPTAIWHLLCEDDDAIDAVRRSGLRQVIIGGEPVRPHAVSKWADTVGKHKVSLISTYGPTETTVVVTYLPLTGGETDVNGEAGLRLGRPLVADTVFIAFGELVVGGDLVSSGYLGTDSRDFGTVTTSDGSRIRVFATADRVIAHTEGFLMFSGRRDAVVKISGRRVDTAEVTKRIFADPDVSDVAVELHDGKLGVWFETHRTRRGEEDNAAAARIRQILVGLRISSFFVVGVPEIPRKPNGKIDSATLRTLPEFMSAATEDPGSTERAIGLAKIWSRHLGRGISPASSLLSEGVGSLDLIRILPDSRKHLGWHLSLLDLISADTAANLANLEPTIDDWMDTDTAADIDHDFASLWQHRAAAQVAARHAAQRSDEPPVVVLGASGILGTGFARAVLELRQSGTRSPKVVFVARAELPECGPWAALRDVDGVQIQHRRSGFGPAELAAVISETDARTVVNCVGNTNVLVPYRGLRSANVELVSALAEICASRATRLVHLSTYVVNADVTAPRVTDPREAPYPYAASKSLAELAVAGSPRALDFTMLRLPRVLGEAYQLRDSADILVSVTDACAALGAYPSVTLTEEVTTGCAAGRSIVGLLPELAGPAELGSM